MTHQNNYTFANDLAEKGLEAVPELIRVLINSYCLLPRLIKIEMHKKTRVVGIIVTGQMEINKHEVTITCVTQNWQLEPTTGSISA